VNFYSAALDTPIILATAPTETVDPRSPIAQLLDMAPILDVDDALDQIQQAINSTPDFTDVTDQTTSIPGESAAVLRAQFYRMMRLPEPRSPAETTAIVLPELAIPEPQSHWVRVSNGTTLHRYLAWTNDAHLVVRSVEPDTARFERADVLVNERPGNASHWIRGTLERLPGAFIAAARTRSNGWLIGHRDGTLLDCSEHGDLVASLLYDWLHAGNSIEDFPVDATVQQVGPAPRDVAR
jgi:hypothetical protein